MTLDTAALRSAFDLVYKNPPSLGKEAWLFGDGAAGATLWNPPDGLRLQLGHTDLLDGGPGSAAEEEGVGVCLRHAASFGLTLADQPLFDPRYLSDYDGKLRLDDGVLEVSGTGVYGSFGLLAFYCESPAVFVLEYEDECTRPVERRLRFERRGSRTLDTGTRESGDPTQAHRPPTVEIAGDSRYLLSTVAGGSAVATALALEAVHGGEECASTERIVVNADEHGLTVTVPARERVHLRCLFAMSVVGHGAIGRPLAYRAESPAAAVAVARSRAAEGVEAGAQMPTDELLSVHRGIKKRQWDRTFLHLPDDEHFTQLYWLGRYYLKASYRGAVPPFFINGPWGWMEDVRMWPGCWFHWNLHGAACSLAHIGEAPSLLGPYAAWRMRQLPTALENAKNDFGCNGAAFQDQQLPHGATNTWTGQRHTHFLATGAQAALHLFDTWRFTGDSAFLSQVAYPYMAAVVEFWRCYLVPDSDGVLHSPASIPYEYHGDDLFQDCLPDLAHLRALFPAFARAAAAAGTEDALSAWALEATTKLAPFVPVELPLHYVTRLRDDGTRIYDNPFFFGEPAEHAAEVLAIGKRSGDDRWVDHVSTHFDGRSGYGAFCSSQTAHVYPAALVSSDASPGWAERTGADEEEQRQWERAVNALRTIRRYPSDESSFDKAGVADPTIAWTGHSLELPAFARLGLTEALARAMRYYVDRYQIFKQGMWNYHPRKRWSMDAAHPRFPDGSTGHIDYNPWLLHFGMEPQGIFAEALSLMLCDSANETIRLFQAYDGDAMFTLPARGGFLVTAQQIDGELRCVEIESTRGEPCAIRLPWDEALLRLSDGSGTTSDSPDVQTLSGERGVCRFETEAGGRYRVFPSGGSGEFVAMEVPTPRPRELGSSVLGIPRRF